MPAETESGIQTEGVAPDLLRRQATVLASNFYQGPSSRKTREVLGELTGDPDNPWLALSKMTDEGFRSKIASNGFGKSIPTLHKEYSEYMSKNNETWFEKTTLLSSKEKEYLRKHPIASTGLEIAISKMPQIYSGGLGMLNGDVARQESDMGLPVNYFSILYKGGYLLQKIENGCQVEEYCDQNGNDYPMSEAKDTNGKPIGLIKIPMGKNHEVFVKTWEVNIGRNKAYLFDTNIPENTDQGDKGITGHLYSEVNNDTRIRQEILLGVATVRAEKALGIEHSIYHLQEGHSAFAILDATSDLVEKGMSLNEAGEKVTDKIAFTDHTVVVNDFFSKELIGYYLDSHAKRMSTAQRPVTTDDLYNLGKDDQGRFAMTLLALRKSGKKNGVSEIHTEVLREQYPGQQIESVTNGVHLETWIGEPMHDLLDKHLGQAWRKDPDNKRIFNEIRLIPTNEVWEARQEQKRRLINYLNNKYGCNLSSDYLTACIARRFATYKRNSLLFYDMDKLSEIVGNDKTPLQVIIGGKAHPHDLENKYGVIKNINDKIKDFRLKGRAVFVTEYDMELAKKLVAGVDLWINTPRRKHEASGTSGMKASANGVLQFTERDGWANEVEWWDKGWTIGRPEDDANKMSKEEMEIIDRRDAEETYKQFKESIVPTYYFKRGEWVGRIKNTMAEVLENFSTHRMVKQKIEKIYRPLLQKQIAQTA
jgi:glycogen phosphorylase